MPQTGGRFSLCKRGTPFPFVQKEHKYCQLTKSAPRGADKSSDTKPMMEMTTATALTTPRSLRHLETSGWTMSKRNNAHRVLNDIKWTFGDWWLSCSLVTFLDLCFRKPVSASYSISNSIICDLWWAWAQTCLPTCSTSVVGFQEPNSDEEAAIQGLLEDKFHWERRRVCVPMSTSSV